jgi:hypothetical protein
VPQKSILADWHQRASVRSRPRRLVDGQLSAGKLVCFPPELTPFVHSPLLTSAHPAIVRDGLTQQLFSYLHFTDRLEHEIVNRVVRRIATGMPGLCVPVETRMDAYKIYCDEAYHSLFSADLMFQIEAASEFRFEPGSGHPALDAFYREVAAVEAPARPWFELFFVVVSETLISGSLLRIPHAEDVIPAVREMVADHAEDESRHHAFFARLCRSAWPQVPENLKIRVGRALPRFIISFLTPDYPAIRAFLRRHFTEAQTQTVIEECYRPDYVLAEARAASRTTLRVLREAGVFDLHDVEEAAADLGLHWRARQAAAG